MKVMLAMSGGVDSSVAGALLLRRRPRRRRRDDEAVGRRQRHRLLSASATSTMRAGSPSSSTSTTSCSTSATTSTSTSSSRTCATTRSASHPTRASSATVTSSSTGCSGVPSSSASTPSRPATTPGSAARRRACSRSNAAPIRPRTRAMWCTCSIRHDLGRTLFPVGSIDKSEVRRLARRTWGCGRRRSPTARTSASSRRPAVARPSSATGSRSDPARSSTPTATQVGHGRGGRDGHDRPAARDRPAGRRAEALRRRRRRAECHRRRRRRDPTCSSSVDACDEADLGRRAPVERRRAGPVQRTRCRQACDASAPLDSADGRRRLGWTAAPGRARPERRVLRPRRSRACSAAATPPDRARQPISADGQPASSGRSEHLTRARRRHQTTGEMDRRPAARPGSCPPGSR